MIRVMVVEDEPPIMRMISGLIEALDSEYKVVATAINGKKALERLENERVEVIFSDIKMPVMGGLELAKAVSELNPPIKIVIISGFKDFEYARDAIRFGVYDYLLKPIRKEDMKEVLAKIKIAIEEEKKKAEISYIHEIVHQERVACLKEDKDKTAYNIYLICIGAFPLTLYDHMIPARELWSRINLEEIILQLIGGENQKCIEFEGKSPAEMIAIVDAAHTSNQQLPYQLIEKLKCQTDLSIHIITSKKDIPLTQIGDKLKELRQKLYSYLKLFKSQVLWLEELEEKAFLMVDIKEILRVLELAYHQGEKALSEAYENLLNDLIDKEITQLQMTYILEAIFHKCYLESYGLQNNHELLKMDINEAMCNACDREGLIQNIVCISKPKEKEKEEIPPMIHEIEAYLMTHYNRSITTTKLSKEFGFVPSYMSKLFKQYKGMSPVEYLMYYRIKKAKEIMLEKPNKLFKEVAREVGFSDPYYFSKIFKKETGLSPTEFTSRI